MTITAQVNIGARTAEHFSSSHEAEEAVRYKFNPSALPAVARIKALTSLLVAEIDAVEAQKPDAGEILKVARQHAVSASMWTVLGATKGLP